MSSTKAKSKPKYSRIKKNYGLDEADYNNLLKRQRYQCAICGIDEKSLTKRLHVDHDHKTGEARGLLCVNCNLGLGSFKDNPEFLLYAVLYLQDHE